MLGKHSSLLQKDFNPAMELEREICVHLMQSHGEGWLGVDLVTFKGVQGEGWCQEILNVDILSFVTAVQLIIEGV